MAVEEGPDSAPPPYSEPMTVPRVRGWFRQAIFASAGAYGEAALVALLLNILVLVVPLFAIVAFDQFTQFPFVNIVWRLAAGIAVVFGFDFVLRMLRSHFAEAVGSAAAARIEDRVFQRMLTAKMADRIDSEDLLAAVASDLKDLRAMMTAAPILALIDLPFIAVFIVACYLIAGPVALIPLIAVPVVLFLSLVLQLPLRSKVAQARDGARQRFRLASETLNGLETVRSVGSERALQRRWENITAETQRNARWTVGLSAWIANLTSVSGNLVLIGVFAYGAFRVFGGDLSIGGLVASALLAAAAMAPLDRLAGILVDYHRGRVALDALDDLMRGPVERPEGVAFAGPTRIDGAIAFQNVTFHYPGQAAPALNGVSFQIEAGEKVGLIGRIGSGKSTIARLTMGLYEPQDGLVAIDKFDIAQIDPAGLRGGIGYVPQDVHLFEGSIRDNIVLGVPSIDDESVQRAARIAGVDEFAEKHPAGYDMLVGARGHALSGGERQAVAVARALVRDPPVLLLDEPTGALDNTSEGRLRARLANAIGGKTLLLITNRASMLSLVDRLIVIDGGQIVADGAKQEVLDGLQGGVIQALQGTE